MAHTHNHYNHNCWSCKNVAYIGAFLIWKHNVERSLLVLKLAYNNNNNNNNTILYWYKIQHGYQNEMINDGKGKCHNIITAKNIQTFLHYTILINRIK